MAGDTKYKNDWLKEKGDRFSLILKKGDKDKIQRFAKSRGYQSLNSFINDAIKEKLERMDYIPDETGG